MSTRIHYVPETLRRYLDGRLDEATADRVRHHLKNCEGCQRRLTQVLTSARGSGSQRYSEAFSQAARWLEGHSLRLARERLEAPALALRLHDLSHGQQRLLASHDPRFQTWGLCRQLLSDAASSVWDGHLENCLRRARTAVLVAEHLDSEAYGSQRIQDLRAEAYGRLGNAHRMAGQYAAAEDSFRTAGRLLRKGGGDPADPLWLAGLRISLATSRGRWNEGWEMARASLLRLPADAEPELRHGLLVQCGVSRVMVDPEAALESYRSVLSADPTEPRLRIVAEHGALLSLIRLDRVREAMTLLSKIRKHPAPATNDSVFDSWLSGLLMQRCGHTGPAIEALRQAVGKAEAGFAAPPRLLLLHFDLAAASLSGEDRDAAQAVAARVAARLDGWGAPNNLQRGWSLIRRRLADGHFDASFRERAYRFVWRSWGAPELEL